MLFVGYDSVTHPIGSVAFALRTKLPEFYPTIRNDLAQIGGVVARRADTERYAELYLVGHSLGGVIVRHALVSIADQWINAMAVDPKERPPDLLDATVRLFSPASAGWRLAGKLGMLQGSLFWKVIHPFACKSPNYRDLRPRSKVLANTEENTKRIISQLGNTAAAALRAHILWADPENIVISERYSSDFADYFQGGTDHRSVCKPTGMYAAPRDFVRTGRP